MFGNSSNPILKDKIFSKEASFVSSTAMTVNGTIEKTFILLLVTLISAIYTWRKFFFEGGMVSPEGMYGWIIAGALGGFIVAIAITFMKKYSAFLAPVYAILEGMFLGAISALFEAMYPGIVMNAVLGTFGTFLFMLFAYRSGMIKVTNKLRSIIMSATFGIAIMYGLSWILSMFGVGMPFLHGSGIISIGVSLFIIVVAAFNLLLDFDMIERASAMGAPKYMEWFGAFGILVTLVWLYIEFLRLLSKLRD